MSLLNEYSALVIAAVLILASVPIVFAFDRARIIDHLARSLVAIGVGLMAAFVAVTIFDLNAQRLENERNLGQQQVKRSKMLTLSATCGILLSNMASPPIRSMRHAPTARRKAPTRR